MRIGLDFRMLSTGPRAVNRGMGRYTQQQLREVLRIDQRNEYVLLCDPHSDASLVLPEIRTAKNVSIARISYPGLNCGEDPNLPENALRHSAEYQDALYQQQLDLYHATTPFLVTNLVQSHFDVCPMVATMYDLIPLIYPTYYLPKDGPARELYGDALHCVERASRLIAISESARRDAASYIGFPRERIDLAYPIADPCFHVLPQGVVNTQLQELRRRIRLPEQFVLSVTYFHHTKNMETLLAAYAMLPRTLRHTLPLVLTFIVEGRDQDYVQALLEQYGIANDVLLSGLVTDDEIVALYNAATMVIHPSRYEGFGLPVLEALSCGTPVITSTTSSLPEAGGDAAILVDPDDVRSFAEAIELVATEPARRATMRERGLRHAASFNAEQLGRNTLACYEAAMRPSTSTKAPQRPHIALWTPLPPQHSGVADYAAELLPSLTARCDVEIFVDDGYRPASNLLHTYRIHHYQAFERRLQQQPFDAIVYQVGASPFHLYLERFIERYPGIVVLHDLVWGLILYVDRVGRKRDLNAFKSELRYSEGAQALRAFDRLQVDTHGQTGEQYWVAFHDFLRENLMLRRIVDASIAQVMHMDLGDELTHKYPNARPRFFPMAVADPLHTGMSDDATALRRQHGLAPTAFSIGVFGAIDPVKRLDVCIRAFKMLHNHCPASQLLIVGETLNESYKDELHQLVTELGLERQVCFTGRVAKPVFDQLMLVCDIIVNLRYPSRKQMSAVLMRAIAAGKPTIVTDLPEWRFLPSDVCLRVSPNSDEVATLAEHLRGLATDPASRSAMGQRARAFYEEQGSLSQMAQHYVEVVEEVTGRKFATVPERKDVPAVRSVNHNKVSELEDFTDPELIEIMRDVFRHEIRNFTSEFPRGAEYRKYWEIAMSVRALRHFGAMRPDADILGVGAGTEATIYYLANHVGRVFATDIYLSPGSWGSFAPGFMLVEPERVAPYDFHRERLVVQHMDGRALRYSDNSFDGIFSSGSIEHFGDMHFIANAAYEMGRVLKPGGILTLSTEYRISGPPGGNGWDGLRFFSAADLQRYIVEASGLELVDPLHTEISDQTLETKRDFTTYANDLLANVAEQGRYPRVGEIVWSKYPHLVLYHEGYVFCSVHLTLRKPDNYPVAPNDWARPSAATLAAVEELSREITLSNPALVGGATPSQAEVVVADSAYSSTSVVPAPNVTSQALIRSRIGEFTGVLLSMQHRLAERLPEPLSFSYRTLRRIRKLGLVLDAQAHLYPALAEYQAEMDNRLTATDRQLAAQTTTTAVVPERVQEVANTQVTLTAQVNELFHSQNGISDQLRQLATENAELSNQLRELAAQSKALTQQVTALQESQTTTIQQLGTLAEAHTAMARQVRLTTSQDRLRKLRTRAAQLGDQETERSFRLPDDDLLALLQQLEEGNASLRTASSVELSIQDAQAEELLIAGATYFGDRLSAKPPTYRLPNDAWYHIDFTSNWNRAILFENAQGKLAPAGYFVLVTDPHNTSAPVVEYLAPVSNQEVALLSGRQVRVLIWRRPDEAAPSS